MGRIAGSSLTSVGVGRTRRALDEPTNGLIPEAADGDDAERVFAQHADSIDLVVTDVVMPGCGVRRYSVGCTNEPRR